MKGIDHMLRTCRVSGFFLAILFAAFSIRPAAAEAPGATGKKKPLKVFILAGQSNMQGHAHVRTFDAMALDPKTAPILKAMQNADGSPRVCEKVWISSIGSADEEQTGKLTAGFGANARGAKIGPEFTFGIFMEKLLDEPILIIKTAWGGQESQHRFPPAERRPLPIQRKPDCKTLNKQGKDIEEHQSRKGRKPPGVTIG